MSSGQCSPEYCGEDHLDSGTCSDVEVSGCGGVIMATSDSPPPLPPKGFKKKTIKLSESTCSDASSAASSSSDSMQYQQHVDQLISPDLIRSISKNSKNKSVTMIKSDDSIVGLLPRSLLQDIRTHSMTSFLRNELEQGGGGGSLSNDEEEEEEEEEDSQNESEELNYSDIVLCSEKRDSDSEKQLEFYDDDKFYKFHINESFSQADGAASMHDESDESFAGYKDIRSATSTIRSSKGTIRGVKNRVRNGIATFLQMQQTTVKVCVPLARSIIVEHFSQVSLCETS
jgi:glutaredoxin domain-containing cysteine-rich protein 1